uniref:RING-type E3 ubiquitin transferase n=1 Tax=Bionectria ochroleuca TaxID=29856 RepID=A0A0B7JVU7_BIOOC
MSAGADEADRKQRQTQRLVTINNVPTTDDATPTCVICCDPISDPSETQPCKHRHFDYLCIATWLFKDPRCPVCRAPVSSLIQNSTQEVLSNFGDAKLPLHVSPPATHPVSTTRWGRQPTSNASRRPHARSSGAWGRSPLRSRNDFDRALSRRQAVYAHGQFSKHVGSNRLSRYRELTPRLFCEDEELVSRARMWIRRELQVFPFLRAQSTASPQDLDSSDRLSSTSSAGQHRPSDRQEGEATQSRRAQNAEFLLEYIIAILKSVDMMGSAGEAENMISDFLGRDNTRLFLHELRAWLRSPYTKLEDWDRAVQYHDEHQSRSERPESSAGRRRHPREEFDAFYLNPNAPTKSLPLNEYLASRFGPDRIGPMHSHMKALGAQEGIDFTFKSRTGNTRDSHRLVKFGKAKDAEHKVRAGLDGAEAKAWLDEGKGGKEVDEEVSKAYDMGIHGVPKFIVNGKYQIDGAQEFSVFADTLRKAAAQ